MMIIKPFFFVYNYYGISVKSSECFVDYLNKWPEIIFSKSLLQFDKIKNLLILKIMEK
jgi:hypothetical protein